MLELRTRESQAIIQAFGLGQEIKGRVWRLEVFEQCDSGRRVVKAEITWCLIADADSVQ